jgi:HD-GYP domain-containing protein (c-di-GMP phosphodiesterase class II)
MTDRKHACASFNLATPLHSGEFDDEGFEKSLTTSQRAVEIILILVTLGLTVLLYQMQGYKMVILNLFFLPVVVAGFFLGRYRAGVMAVLSVIGASAVMALSLPELSRAGAPLVIALAVTVWAAVLGLTAVLVGTLSDERTNRLKELHDAYVGVVEVLSEYLQGAHPRIKARSTRVAELCHHVAARLKLSPREVDDIRVGALLYDVGNIEITTRVIRRAVETLDIDPAKVESRTIQGTDLMLSLAGVLSGAVPLLLNQQAAGVRDEHETAAEVPLGARIIFAVRAYDALTDGAPLAHRLVPIAALRELHNSRSPIYDPAVLAALERVVLLNERAISLASATNGDVGTTEHILN